MKRPASVQLTAFLIHDLNQELLASDIGLVATQHLESGAGSAIYLRAGQTKLKLFGSYETSFREDDSNSVACPTFCLHEANPAWRARLLSFLNIFKTHAPSTTNGIQCMDMIAYER